MNMLYYKYGWETNHTQKDNMIEFLNLLSMFLTKFLAVKTFLNVLSFCEIKKYNSL